MEHISEIEQIIREYAPQVVIYGLMSLGALVVLAGAYVTATPSPDDDIWYNKIMEKPIIGHLMKIFVSFSPVAKKEGVLGISNKVKKEEEPGA